MDRAIVPRLAFTELPKLRARKWRSARYTLHTDIAQFYSSVYTHSIPWALHTKSVAKSSIGKTLGDQLDDAIRFGQHGQTVGIPIGPDASLIIAECILTSVDKSLAANCGSLAGFRYVDDYEIGFKTLGEAEQALSYLQGHLAEYELQLNPNKTRIIEAPRTFQDSWTSELHRYPVRDTGPQATLNDAIGFFSRAFELATEHREKAVLRYAITRASTFRLSNVGWRTFEGLLLSAVSSDPSTFPVAIATLSLANSLGTKVTKSAVQDVIEGVIARNCQLANGSEVAWALWAAILFEIDLSSSSAKLVSAMEDDIVALLALDANSRGLFPKGSVDLTLWTQLASQVGNHEHWLLAYEASTKGWIQANTGVNDPFMGALSNAGVFFYDTSIRPVGFTGAARSVPGGKLSFSYV